MAWTRRIAFLVALLVGIIQVTSAQLSVITSNLSVAYLQEADLRCSLTGYSGNDPVSIIIQKASGSHSHALFIAKDTEATLNITAGQYDDSGEYICTVTVPSSSGNQTLTSTFYFEVQERFVFLSQPTNQTDVIPGTTRRLLCHPNLVQVVGWKKNGLDIIFNERVTQFNLGITINSVSYTDMGWYTCVVDYMNVLQNASAIISVRGYIPPRGNAGIGYVKSSETPALECSVGGVPGPVEVYWQKGTELNATRITNSVTNSSTSTMGPFVDSLGRLDLTRANTNDTGFYSCTGIDVVGGSGSQVFRIEIVAPDTFAIGRQWYFILLYCMIVLILITIPVLVIWCLYSTRSRWWISVTKVIQVKQKIRRHTNKERTSLDDDEAIDEYAR